MQVRFNPFTAELDFIGDPAKFPGATKPGQFLCSIDGSTFVPALPVVDDNGDLVTDQNYEVVVEL